MLYYIDSSNTVEIMRIATVALKSRVPYSQSKPHNEPKKPKENANDYEARTWGYRIHSDKDGVYIPAMALQNCISEAAKFLSLQIPGKGKSTYTKHFEAGVMVPEHIHLQTHDGDTIQPASSVGVLKMQAAHSPDSINKQQAEIIKGWERPANEVWGDWVFVPSDGVAGSGKRVWKCYPMISNWQGMASVVISDETITNEVFKKVLTQAGLLIGMGRFRVRNRGNYGTFSVEDCKFSEIG